MGVAEMVAATVADWFAGEAAATVAEEAFGSVFMTGLEGAAAAETAAWVGGAEAGLAGLGAATAAGTGFMGGEAMAGGATLADAGVGATVAAEFGGAGLGTVESGVYAAPSVWQSLEAGSMPSWGSIVSGFKDAAAIAGPAMSIYSGISGMGMADQMRKQAAASRAQATPWQASGGMALADRQLQQTLVNPAQISMDDPAMQLRLQAVQRANAGYGQNSGRMSVEAANSATDWYNQRLAALGGLAGANANPAAAAQVSAMYDTSAADLTSRGLASIGYGATRAGGPQMTPEVAAYLKAQGYPGYA